MKAIRILAIASTIFAFSSLAHAQTQNEQTSPGMEQEQQACESDVYALCGEAIPDTDRITACLRAHWSKVSRQCRAVMANYGKHHHGRRERESD
jgi:hypothetical protein